MCLMGKGGEQQEELESPALASLDVDGRVLVGESCASIATEKTAWSLVR